MQKNEIYFLDTFEEDLDDLKDKVSTYQYIVPPYDKDDLNKSSQILINLKHQLNRDGINVMGVVNGKGQHRTKTREWVEWLELNGFSGYWPEEWELRGPFALELRWEGIRWNHVQYISGHRKLDPKMWPFTHIEVEGTEQQGSHPEGGLA